MEWQQVVDQAPKWKSKRHFKCMKIFNQSLLYKVSCAMKFQYVAKANWKDAIEVGIIEQVSFFMLALQESLESLKPLLIDGGCCLLIFKRCPIFQVLADQCGEVAFLICSFFIYFYFI